MRTDHVPVPSLAMSQRTKTITINIDRRVLDYLDQFVQRHQPLLSRHKTARAALNLGLEVLDAKPELLVQFFEHEKRAMKNHIGFTARQPLEHAEQT